MARIRTIKPEFWTHEDLSELPPETHMLAAALLNYADDKGYFNANPKLIKAACCPLREDSTSVRRSIDELSKIQYLEIAEASDGKQYGRIATFCDHQRVDRGKPSKIKELFESSKHRRTIVDGSSPEQGTGNREQGTGKEEGAEPETASPPASADDDPVFLTVPLNDKSEYPVTASQVREWRALFPGVDVAQSLRNLRGWNLAKPARRKTRRGIVAHITAWLSRDQDRGSYSRPAKPGPALRGSRDYSAGVAEFNGGRA